MFNDILENVTVQYIDQTTPTHKLTHTKNSSKEIIIKTISWYSPKHMHVPLHYGRETIHWFKLNTSTSPLAAKESK